MTIRQMHSLAQNLGLLAVNRQSGDYRVTGETSESQNGAKREPQIIVLTVIEVTQVDAALKAAR
jgi:hypothetical protein